MPPIPPARVEANCSASVTAAIIKPATAALFQLAALLNSFLVSILSLVLQCKNSKIIRIFVDWLRIWLAKFKYLVCKLLVSPIYFS